MATTYTYSGTRLLALHANVTATGDQQGTMEASVSTSRSFAPAGGDAPTVSGYLKGNLTVSGSGDIALAHASDPLGSYGDSGYSPGFTVAGTKIKAFLFRNTDATNNITVTRKAATGCPIFGAAGDAVTLGPGDVLYLEFAAGTAALTSGANDALTLAPGAGSPTAEILVAYGP